MEITEEQKEQINRQAQVLNNHYGATEFNAYGYINILITRHKCSPTIVIDILSALWKYKPDINYARKYGMTVLKDLRCKNHVKQIRTESEEHKTAPVPSFIGDIMDDMRKNKGETNG